MIKPSYITCKRSPYPFRETVPTESLGDLECVEGKEFHKTYKFSPDSMAYIISRDIDGSIAKGEIPKIRYSVIADTSRPIPCYRVTIYDMSGPLVDSFDIGSQTEWIHVDTCHGQAILHHSACAVFEHIMQIIWRYNADVISYNGIYGHRHFTYQIMFSKQLVDAKAEKLLEKLQAQDEEFFDEDIGLAA